MYLFVLFILILYIISFFSPNIASISKDKVVVLKSLMAILIVLHHLSLQGILFLQMFHSWGAPIVSVFLFLSGYGLMKSLHKKGKEYLSDFFKHRIGKGLLFPFFIAWGIYRILNITSLPNIFKEVEELLYNGTTILPHSWFVFAILCFYLFFYITYRFFRSWLSSVVIIFFFVLYEILCKNLNYDRCWYISAFSFPTGLLFCKYENEIIKYIKGSISYYLIVPVALSIIAICVYLKIEMVYLLVYVLIPLIFAVILLKVQIDLLIKFKLIKYLSNISFEIYLSQGISMCILRGYFFYVELDFLYVVLTLTLTIIIAMFIKQIRDSFLRCCFKSNI